MNAWRAAWRAVAGHLGLVVSTYLIGLAVASIASMWFTFALIAQLGSEPLFDRAVSGDLAALIVVLIETPGIIVWGLVLALAALSVYIVVSWFLTAGILGVFAHGVVGGQTARAFGRWGAHRFWSFARLWVWSWVPYLVVIVLLIIGLDGATDDLTRTFTGRELFDALLWRCAPALVALWLSWTIIDVARADLIRRARPQAWRAMLAAIATVARRPRLFAVTFAGHLLSTTIVMVSLWLGGLAGGVGAIAVRQVLALLRHAVHVGVLGAIVDGTEPRPRAPAPPRQTSSPPAADEGAPAVVDESE